MWLLKSSNIIYIYIYTYLHILTNSLHGAESFLRSQPVFSQSRNSPHFVEPEGSLPHSQLPTACPHPEPARSNPYPHIPLPEDPSYYYPAIYAWFSLFFKFPHQNPVYSSPLLHMRHMSRPSHSSWFYHPNTHILRTPKELLSTLWEPQIWTRACCGLLQSVTLVTRSLLWLAI